ncbi:MAG: biotin--[acetyl-CoA-carboxylase] ligase [Flavobacteriaceae bacterium]
MKLHTVPSTNDYLKELSGQQTLDDFTVVFAEHQTKGKGQLGTVWESNKSENLTFSVFVDTSFIDLQRHFYLNCAVSIAVLRVLQKYMLPQLSVKWPNDILSGCKKLSGILIENSVKSSVKTHSIIGIGVNVNQTKFNSEYRASSLKSILGKEINLEELLILIVAELQTQIAILRQAQYDSLHAVYETHLFRKNKPSTFENIEGVRFSGFIKNVTSTGELQVLVEDDVLKQFKLKEVKLLY